MGCRCSERGAAIVKGVRLFAKGEIASAADKAKFVVQSAAEDAKTALQRKVSAARTRLTMR